MGSLDTSTKARLGASIGRFLQLLHGTELADVPARSIEDEIANYEEKYRLAIRALTESFSDNEMRTVEAFFLRELPTDMRRLGDQLRLSHGDLGPWNIIVGPDQNRLFAFQRGSVPSGASVK